MKTLAAMLAGLLLSIVTFTIGVMGSLLYLSTPEKAAVSTTRDVTDLWTTKPTLVRTERALERVTHRQAVISVDRLNTVDEVASQDGRLDHVLDRRATAPTSEPAQQEDHASAILPIAHLDWCSSRYNSYRAEDDTFKPYAGERRRCVSPYPAAQQSIAAGQDGIVAEVQSSAARSLADIDSVPERMTADLDDHIFQCSKRYRSYRIEDNSYQPFDGGPRRQCQ